MKKTEVASNPFTPKSGWEPKIFAGRENEIEFFHRKLEEARQGRCDHFLVLGEWGIGKTSLLREFKRIAQRENILTSLITIGEYTEKSTFMDGVKGLIEEIPQRFPTDISRLKGFTKQLNELGVQILGSGFTLSRTIGDMQPQSLLFNTMRTLWGDLKDETEVALVLLDDAQNFDPISGIFTILKNVLSDEEIVKTRFLFVLSCTPEMWKQFLVRHHPIGRYFTPRLTLERLNKEKTLEILDKTLEGTGIVFDGEIKEKVYEFTGGHPYELQVLCFNLYENQIASRVTKEVWSISLKDSLKELGEIVFDGFYEKASKQEKNILYLISLLKGDIERRNILEISKDYDLNFSENAIDSALHRLTEKSLLRRTGRSKYSLPDKIFREYVLQIRGYNGNGRILSNLTKREKF